METGSVGKKDIRNFILSRIASRDGHINPQKTFAELHIWH